MQNILLIVHLVVGVLFIFSVLVQDKGVGFGTAIGGAGGGGFYATQRGAAKVLNYLSIVLASLFLVSALLYVVAPGSDTTSTPGDLEGQPINLEAGDIEIQ